MIDPSDALQAAVFAALTTSADMIAAFGGEPRVFDNVPAGPGGGPTFPYVQIGDDQIVDDGNGCGEASQAFVTVHVFSRAAGPVGRGEVKRIAAAVRQALSALIPVDGQRTVDFLFQDCRVFNDPDGLTAHAVHVTRYSLEPLTE